MQSLLILLTSYFKVLPNTVLYKFPVIYSIFPRFPAIMNYEDVSILPMRAEAPN